MHTQVKDIQKYSLADSWKQINFFKPDNRTSYRLLEKHYDPEQVHTSYMPQVSQLPELQLAQEFPPSEVERPRSLLEKQANLDNTRSASCWQLGQQADSVA